jgi:hypothetical protein
MENEINYLIHNRLIEPPDFQRRFDLDLPEKNDSTLKRAALIALPFVSLYGPLGSAISLSMGACRSITHLTEALDAFKKGDYVHYAGETTQTALAVLSIGATLTNFSLGLVITTVADLSVGLYRFTNSGEEAMQTLSSALYLGILFTGSLEIILLSALLQAAISIYQARNELKECRYPEALAKIAMGMVRLNQAHGHYRAIQQRDALLSLDFFRQLHERAQKGRDGYELLDNPLIDLPKNIAERRVILSDANEKQIDFGSHFDGHGEQLVKGMNLAFRTKVIDGKELIELDFKVNHVFRAKLEELIAQYKQADPSKLKDMLKFSHSHVKNIRIEATSFPVGNDKIGPAYKFELEGLGTLFVGSSPNCYTLYDRVLLRFDRKASLFACHEALSLFNLEEALRVSANEDIERMKIGHLFRTLCPKEATPFERSPEFFDLSIEELKQRIVEKAPQMQEAFSTYLDKMEARELFPGRTRYAIPGLADHCHELGARGVIASVTGGHSKTALFDRIASMLKMGMICSEDRLTSDLYVPGLSSGFDFNTGGADSVFTQMVTERQCKEHMPLDDFAYFHSIALMFPLEVLETGTYQYHYDSFGKRTHEKSSWWWGSDYFSRPGIFDFVKQRQIDNPGYWFDSNEVMIKERIPPSLIKGLILRDEILRMELLEHLRKRDLVQRDPSGAESILGIPVERFLRVATTASEDLFN